MDSAARPQLASLSLAALRSAWPGLFEGVDEAVVFRLPMRVRFRGITERNGVLLRGPSGWGEFAPFWDYDAARSAPWLLSALDCAGAEAGVRLGWESRGALLEPRQKRISQTARSRGPVPSSPRRSPASRPDPGSMPPQPRGCPPGDDGLLFRAARSSVPVNVTVPVIPVENVAGRLDSQPGCSTAKVKVADRGVLDEGDVLRVAETARLLADRYGPAARVRVDANAAWSIDEAARALDALDAAAAPVEGLEYAEQPCRTVSELAELRRMTAVPIAADESIRLSRTPLEVRDRSAADVAVLKVAPLGGVARALELSVALGLPAVVSSALDTSIGLAAGVRLAAALPQLNHACGLNTGSLLAADVVDSPLLSSADHSPGYLTVADADRAATGDLTRHADLAPVELVDAWQARLDAVSRVLAVGA